MTAPESSRPNLHPGHPDGVPTLYDDSIEIVEDTALGENFDIPEWLQGDAPETYTQTSEAELQAILEARNRATQLGSEIPRQYDIAAVEKDDPDSYASNLSKVMSSQEQLAHQMLLGDIESKLIDNELHDHLRVSEKPHEHAMDYKYRQKDYLEKLGLVVRQRLIDNRHLYASEHPGSFPADLPDASSIDVLEDGHPFVEYLNSREQNAQPEVSKNESEDRPESKSRFSKMLTKAKKSLTVDEARWNADPRKPHPQGFDNTDTWQDPFEKFYGPAGPVKEYSAVPPLRQKAKKVETADIDNEDDVDITEKQSRRKRVIAKVTGAWAVAEEIARELYDLPNHMPSRNRELLNDIEAYIYTNALESDILDDEPTAAQDNKSNSGRLQKVMQRTQLLATRTHTPETKKRIKKAVAVGAMGVAAIAATQLRRK